MMVTLTHTYTYVGVKVKGAGWGCWEEVGYFLLNINYTKNMVSFFLIFESNFSLSLFP